MIQRYLWKIIPKTQREILLERLSVVDRQVVNKSLSGQGRFPEAFARQGCLFIHVPKCAGSSVCAALFDDWYPGHMPAYWYERQFPQQFAQSFKFTFVRDPLERAYSAYAFLRGNTLSERDQLAQRMVRQYVNFDDFVGRWLCAENVSRQVHFAPQTDFLVDSMGAMSMDFIGRQEHLDRDFVTLSQHLGSEVALPRVNATVHRESQAVRDFCTARTRRQVRRVYHRDYEMLGYE